MGIGNLGLTEMLVIGVIILIFFGPNRLPEIARSLGHAMREFRRSLNQIQRELEDADPRRIINDPLGLDRELPPHPDPQGESPAESRVSDPA